MPACACATPWRRDGIHPEILNGLPALSRDAYSMGLLTVIDEALAEVYLRRAGRIDFEVAQRPPDDVLAEDVNPLRTLLAACERAALRKTHVLRACSFNAANS